MEQEEKKDNKSLVAKKQFAGFIVRFAAFAVDFLVLVLISVFAGIFFAVTTRVAKINWDIEVVASFVGFLLNAGYYIFTTYRYGATVGKKVFGLKVESVKEEKLDIGTVIVREVAGKFISTMLAGLGYFWIIFDKKKQGFHDKLAGTVVVIDDKGKVAKWKTITVAVLFAIFLTSFSFWIALGVLDEDFQEVIDRDKVVLSVNKVLVSAKLCVSEGNSIEKPLHVYNGGGDICAEVIGIDWPKLLGGYEYGKIDNDFIFIQKNGIDIVRCEIGKTTCILIDLPE